MFSPKVRCSNCLGTPEGLFQSTKICKDFKGTSHQLVAATLCDVCLAALKAVGVKMRESVA